MTPDLKATVGPSSGTRFAESACGSSAPAESLQGGLRFEFRRKGVKPYWSGRWFDGILAEERRQRERREAALDADLRARSRARMDRARQLVAEFMAPEHVDLAAVALITMRATKPRARITRQMVRERLKAQYPWIELAA
jgi:hypothetical protein